MRVFILVILKNTKQWFKTLNSDVRIAAEQRKKVSTFVLRLLYKFDILYLLNSLLKFIQIARSNGS